MLAALAMAACRSPAPAGGKCRSGFVENAAGKCVLLSCEDANCAPRDVTASIDRVDVVHLSWAAPAGGFVPAGYRILRDGETIADVGPGVLVYDDAAAPAGEVIDGEIVLNASRDRTEGIELTWSSALSPIPGSSVTYVIEAVYSTTSRKGSVEVEGNRAPPPVPTIIYELRRDGGDWFEIGAAVEYLDEAAPMGTLTGVGFAEARPDPTRGIVVLEWMEESVSVIPAAEVGYQVRVQIGTAAKTSNAAAGRRQSSTSPLLIRWERSVAPGSSEYAELPDVTGRIWFDSWPVVGEEHGYRAMLLAPGAVGTTPEATARLPAMVGVSAGSQHTCGIREDGRAICWGDNTNGKAPPEASADTFRSIAAGGAHTCGIRDDGKVICWGVNFFGQAPPGASADTFQSIATGGSHTCGIQADRKIICWGSNHFGEPPPEVSTDSFQAIASGSNHTCGIGGDGKVI